MKYATVTLSFQVENVEGKTVDEVTEIVDEQLRKFGLDKVFRPLWEVTRIFDEKGNVVDSDYC